MDGIIRASIVLALGLAGLVLGGPDEWLWALGATVLGALLVRRAVRKRRAERSELEYGVEATLRLRAAEAGGPAEPVETGSRTLLLRFGKAGREVRLGAVVELRDRERLGAGDEAVVLLRFWSPKARRVAVANAVFTAWDRREVGNGRIVRVVDDG